MKIDSVDFLFQAESGAQYFYDPNMLDGQSMDSRKRKHDYRQHNQKEKHERM